MSCDQRVGEHTHTCAEVAALRAELDQLRDRIATIADEGAGGPHPVMAADESLTLIERELFEARQKATGEASEPVVPPKASMSAPGDKPSLKTTAEVDSDAASEPAAPSGADGWVRCVNGCPPVGMKTGTKYDMDRNEKWSCSECLANHADFAKPGTLEGRCADCMASKHGRTP